MSVGDSVSLPSREGPVTGTVRAVSPGVDAQTRTGTVHVDLPDPGSLQPGSYVEGRIQVGKGSGLTVPAAAVVLRDGLPYVFTVDEQGVARRVRVQTGAAVDGRTVLLDGVAAGDKVVLEGAGFLGDGDRVRVVDGSATESRGAAAPAAPDPRPSDANDAAAKAGGA